MTKPRNSNARKASKTSGREDAASTIRSCVGCRQAVPTSTVERFVYLEGPGLIFDLRQKAPGRGAYVHPTPQCLEAAVSRGGFARGFKQRVNVPSPDEIVVVVQAGISQRLKELLQVTLAAKKAVVGETRVKEAMRENCVAYLFVANDAGDSTRQKYLSNAQRKGIEVCTSYSGESLGQLTGREFVAVLAIVDQTLAERLRNDVEKLNVMGMF